MATSPSRAHPAGRRFTEDALLDAARDVFHERGFNATQITDIAEYAGTTKPTLYARLGNKEQIYGRVLDREAQVLTRWLLDAYLRTVDLSLAAMVDAALQPFFRFAAERRAGFDLLFGNEPSGSGSAVAQRFLKEIQEPVAGLIRARFRSAGADAGPAGAGTLAAATIGVSLHVCMYAVDNDLDLVASEAVGTAYIESAFRSLDLSAVARLDQAQGG
jgi:AcrR family transcriptional regulator